MSSRALREAAKAVERSKGASYGGKDANTLNELLDCINAIMKEDEITQYVTSDLVKFFKTTAPAAYELLPRESLSLAGETIAYIAGVKLENAASAVTHGTKSPFEYWEEVLDCGLVSGLQAYQDSANYDKVLMGEIITAPITGVWKSPLRSRLQIDFRVALLTLLSDCVRRCLPNANLLLDPKVFGSHQFGLAISTAYESLILDILLELLVRTIHAAFRAANPAGREAVWREILQSGPMRVAFGPDVVVDLTTAAVSANNVTFHAAMMRMMELMAVDEARPQPFDAIKIEINGQSYRPSSRQKSLVLDEDSIILNTSNERGDTESFIIRYVTIKQIRIESDKRSVEVDLKLTTSPKLLFGRDASQSANSALVALRVPSEDGERLRNGLRARRQTSKIFPGDSTSHIKRMRSSKTAAIQLPSKFPSSSTEERAQEIVLTNADFESSDVGIEDLTAHTKPSPASVIAPSVLGPSQQTLHVQDDQESEAQALRHSIFDDTSDDALSEAPSPPPSPSPPDKQPAPSPTRVMDSLSCDILNHSEHTPAPEAHANKLLHPAPAQEARGSPFKKRKLQQTPAKAQASKEQVSPMLSDPRRTHRTVNTYKRRKATPASPASVANDHIPSPDPIDFDDIPSVERDSTDLNHQQTAKPKKRGRPPRRNPNLAPQFNGPAYGQQPDTKFNSAFSKQPTRRILSDLEPALSQSLARSAHHTPTPLKALQTDAACGKSDQNALINATNLNVHAKRGTPILNTDSGPTSHHDNLAFSQAADTTPSPISLGDVTLVQSDILEAQVVVQEAVVKAFVVELAEKARVIRATHITGHDQFRIPSYSSGEPVPPRPRSPGKPRAKCGVVHHIPAASCASSSPTPGSRAQKGFLSLRKEQISKPWFERAQTEDIDTLRLSKATRAATVGPETRFSKPGPPIVEEIVDRSAFQRDEDDTAPGVWHGQQTPIRRHLRMPTSSPLLASAMKSNSNTSGPPRPRFSVSFVDDIEARPVSERYTVNEKPPGKGEFRPLLKARRKHVVDEPPEPPKPDVDANWAKDVLQIANSIGEAVVESKRNKFRSIRHEIVVSRDAIINDIQLEVRREAEIYAQHYARFLELSSQHDTIGNQITEAFRDLSLQNTNISYQLQETIRNHNASSPSAKMKTQLFKRRVLGPTFAACGVSLPER